MPRSTPIRDTGLMGRVSGSAKEHTMDIHPLGADMSSGCSSPRAGAYTRSLLSPT